MRTFYSSVLLLRLRLLLGKCILKSTCLNKGIKEIAKAFTMRSVTRAFECLIDNLMIFTYLACYIILIIGVIVATGSET